MDDLIIWADESWCFGDELHEYSWKSDDYRRIPFGTHEYYNTLHELEC